MTLTNRDINKLKEVFATKEDFKNVLTKEDAKAFATKDDLKNLLTKEDAKALATKEDLRVEIFLLREDMRKFPTRDEMNLRFNEVTNSIDWLMGTTQKTFDELTIINERHRRSMEQIENHGKRIGHLEKSPL